MDKKLKLLVLEGREATGDKRIGQRIDRVKIINAIKASGGKVRHDSGGRLIIVEAPETAEGAITKLLPGARLVPLGSEMSDSIAELDPTESLFLKAIQIRSSKSYQEAKRLRIPGESPEEKELFSAPSCIREQY